MPDPPSGLNPSELCSSRAAVRRLRRRCPLAVRPKRAPVRRRLNSETQASLCSGGPYGWARVAALDFKALLHTRVRHTAISCLGRSPSAWLPWVSYPPGSFLRRVGRTPALPPLMGLARPARKRALELPFRVLPRRVRPSLSTRPSPRGLSRLSTTTRRSGRSMARESPPQVPRSVTGLCRTVFAPSFAPTGATLGLPVGVT
jgi:hypothetical protein